jgi:hypothetical protein
MEKIRVREIRVDHSGVSLATRAFNVLVGIPGISNLTILDQSYGEASLTYDWDSAAVPVPDINDRLRPLNAERVDWAK